MSTQSLPPPTKIAYLPREFVLSLVILLLIWSVGLFARTAPFTPDEPREFDIAWNMLHQANKAVPLLAGEPFCEKPPLTYWAAAVSMQLFGPTLWAARLPNLVWAAMTVLCLAAWAKTVVPDAARERTMVLTALIGGSTFLLFRVQIWLATDAPLVAATALALLGAWRGIHAASTRQRLLWYLLFHLGLAGAFFAKNLLGWLVPVTAFGVFALWERRWRELVRWELYAGLLLQIALVLPWVLAVIDSNDGARLLRIFFIDNTLGRFLPIATEEQYQLGHRNHPGKYLVELSYYLLPWTFATVAALRWSIKMLRAKAAAASASRFAIAVVTPGLLILSAAKTARDVYLAPALLGFAMLLGLWLATGVNLQDRFDRVCLRLTVITSIIVGATLIAMSFGVPTLQGQLQLSFPAIAGASMAIVAIGWLTLRWSAQWNTLASAFRAWGVFAVGVTAVSAVLLPALDSAQDLRPTVQAAAKQFKDRPMAALRADETIRAYLDFGAGIAAPNLRTLDDAVQWIDAEPSRVLLVELLTDHVTAGARAHLSAWSERWRNVAPTDINQTAIALQERGLTVLWQYEIGGGRTYGVLGRAH